MRSKRLPPRQVRATTQEIPASHHLGEPSAGAVAVLIEAGSYTLLLETRTTCFGSDNYGMLEALKHITWSIHCSQAGKQPDIERNGAYEPALRGEVVQ